VFDVAGRDPAVIRKLWGAVESGGSFDLKAETGADGKPLWDRVAAYGMVSGASSHANRLDTIRTVYEVYGTMIDPHTADGLKVGLEFREPGVPMICLETAQPAKFDEAIREALGVEPVCPQALAGLEALPQRTVVLDADVAAVKALVAAHSGAA
jgi:threonine synthase